MARKIPEIIKPNKREITTRDISSYIQEIYGYGLSESMVTRILVKY